MDDIQKALQSRRNIRLNHLNLMIGNDIQKGKAAQEGEVREWSGKKYKKQGGEWKEIVEGKRSKEDQSTGDGKESGTKTSTGSSDRSTVENRFNSAKAAMEAATKSGNQEKAAHAKAAMEGYGMQLKKMDSEEKKQKNVEKEQIKNEIKEELKKEMNSPLESQVGKTSSGKIIYDTYHPMISMIKDEFKSQVDPNFEHHSTFSDEEKREARQLIEQMQEKKKKEISKKIKSLSNEDSLKLVQELSKKEYDKSEKSSREREIDNYTRTLVGKKIATYMKSIGAEKVWRGTGGGRGGSSEGWRIDGHFVDTDRLEDPKTLEQLKLIDK